VQRANLDAVLAVLPALNSPTVSHLSDPEWVAVNTIVEEFETATVDAEIARAMREHPQDLDKRDLMFAANAKSLLTASKENYLKRMSMVEQALALDPNYLWALRTYGGLHAGLVQNGYSSDPDTDLKRGLQSLDRALQLAPGDYDALQGKSRVLRAQGDLDGALAVIRKLLELRPRSAALYFNLAVILLIQQHPQEALENYLTAQRRAVSNEIVESLDAAIPAALVANQRYAEAIPQARLAIAKLPPSGFWAEYPWLALIAAESSLGLEADARADLQKFLATPRTRRSIAEIRKSSPSLNANLQLLEGLRRTGMPED